jgi:hypothetical protein
LEDQIMIGAGRENPRKIFGEAGAGWLKHAMGRGLRAPRPSQAENQPWPGLAVFSRGQSLLPAIVIFSSKTTR